VPRILIPSPYRRFTDNESEYRSEGQTVGEAMREFVQMYPAMGQKLLTEEGQMRSYVHVFIGDRDIRFLRGMNTPVDAETLIRLVPAIAGG